MSPASPAGPPSVGSFEEVLVGDQRSRLRSAPGGQRFGQWGVGVEETQNELERLWNRRGIRREGEEDGEDGVTVASITPSESVSRVAGHVSAPSDEEDDDESEDEWD